jgi:ATP-dependent Clp protease protease subunit
MRDDTYLPGVLPMGELAARRLLQQRILLLDGELDDQGGTRLTSQLLLIIY